MINVIPDKSSWPEYICPYRLISARGTYFCTMNAACIRVLSLMLFYFLLGIPFASAQYKIIKGNVRDSHSDEPIPFASVMLKRAGSGILTDSAGNFKIRVVEWPRDTLLISYVGYEDLLLPMGDSLFEKAVNQVLDLSLLLNRGKYVAEVVVKRKIDRGLLMWRRIVRNKARNDRYNLNNFSYELYNKLEIDLRNVKRDRMQKLPILKNYGFIFDNIDTTEEGKPFLPVYLTEALSNYYYQRTPRKRREVFLGTKTLGVKNESVSRLLGGMEQNINFYSNFIPVFDKQFISPVSDNGDMYYRYKVLDTQYVSNRRLIHLQFTPKRKGENTFEGDCWVHDTTWAIQKMSLRLSKEANINFVETLSLIQEFKMVNDTTWFLSRDKFVVDLSFTGEKSLSFIGKKSTTYRNVVINDTMVERELNKNKVMEEIIFPESAKQPNDSFWTYSRHEQLNKNETALYKTIDTLLKMESFQQLTKWVNFIGTGYMAINKLEIGPWFNWITANTQEGMRLRFDLGTTRHFNSKFVLHGYLAYGFTDRKMKGEFDILYLPKKNPRTFIGFQYFNDIDYGQMYYDEITQDNIFALAIRKTGVPIKFLRKEEVKLDFFKETHFGLSGTLSFSHKSFEPLRNLPEKSIFTDANGRQQSLVTFETSFKLRFAYLEKFLDGTFYRYSLGSAYPIVEAKYTRGIAGVAGSNFQYDKLSFSISDYSKVPPFGSLYYNVFGGKTMGTLPYMMLDIAPGNEMYYYNKYSFNLMNRFEYLHDRFLGVNLEHNIGNGLFRFLPITRKLKFRQFWSAKALWGSLREANKAFNMPLNSNYTFESLNGKTYLELGTGVDNIFKVFRMDFLWRVLPRPLPKETAKRFGVFFSFRLAF